MGIPVRFKKMPMLMVSLFMGKEMHQMFKWFNEDGFAANIEDLRARYSEISWTNFETWLTKEGLDKKVQASSIH